MTYNGNFSMQDLFMNDKLKGALPQFKKRNLTKNGLSDEEIYDKCRTLICHYLGGNKVNDDKISVAGKTKGQIGAILQACKRAIEMMLNNFDDIKEGLRTDKKVFISFSTLNELKTMDTQRFKAIIHDIEENLLYNPEFVGDYTEPQLKRKQATWKKKVGYNRRLYG